MQGLGCTAVRGQPLEMGEGKFTLKERVTRVTTAVKADAGVRVLTVVSLEW